MKKQFMLTVFAIGAMNVRVQAMEKTQMLYIGGSFLGTAALMCGTERIAQCSLFQNLSKKTGISKNDMQGIIGTAGTLVSLGFLFKDNQKGFNSYALRIPIAASIGVLTTTKFANNLFEKLPFIGQYLGCSEESCNGVCRNCKIRSYIKVIGSYCLLTSALEHCGILSPRN